MADHSNRTSFGAGCRASAAAPLYALAIVSYATLVPKSVQAQESTPASSGEKLEEVLVTAQKRAENLQQVPISAQVVSGAALTSHNFNSLQDIAQVVPGVQISTNSGNAGNNIFIRGIGSGTNPSFDQSVATFVDDIYHGRSHMSAATFLDLDHIEILKGPQSTYFGNNAIAGAFNIETARPGKDSDGYARVLYGQHGQYAVEGAYGGPLSDTFGARLAVTSNGGTGWIRNINTDQDTPNINNKAARLTLAYRPNESLDATLKLEGSSHTEAGTSSDLPAQWINCPPPAPITPSFAGLGACLEALSLGPARVPIGLNNNETTGMAGLGNTLTTFEDTLTVNYRIGSHTLTSVTGHYNFHFRTTDQGALLPEYYVSSLTQEAYDQFSQEFRLASATDGPFEYLAGVYFQTDHLADSVEVNLPFLDFLADSPPFTALAPYLPLATLGEFGQRESVYSVFGSAAWKVTDRLELNAGLRGSYVKKTANGVSSAGTSQQLFGGFEPVPAEIEAVAGGIGFKPAAPSFARSDKALMPSAGFQYQLTPQAMAYFTYNRGFKAGGNNAQNLLQDVFDPTNAEFGPEFVNAYEVGIKSKWFDDRFLANLAVFRSDYRDLQVNAVLFLPQLNSYNTRTVNAATSRSQGVELETKWVVTRDFHLTANASYLDAKYMSYPNAGTTTLQQFCAGQAALPACNSLFPGGAPPFDSLSGRPTPYAPRFSGSLTASYSFPVVNDYKVTAELSPFATAGYYSNANTNDPFFHVGGYTRLDGRLVLGDPTGHWTLDLIAKNVTNRIIVVAPSLFSAAKEEPRNLAVQFRYQF